MDKRIQPLTERIAEINQQAMDVTDYLCSRGDTMPLRGEVEARTRRILHALEQKGWRVVKKEASGG